MASNLSREFRKFIRSSQLLSRILKETNRSLEEIEEGRFFHGEEVEQELLEVGTTQQLEQLSRFLGGRPVLVVFGQSCESRAHFVNTLLETDLLPSSGGNWRWARILYGRVGHVALTVGLEFEVVEKLQAHEKPWSTVPEEDLRRPPGEDMAVEHLAVVEVQICHPIVRDGTTILVVPDLDYALPDERASISHMLQCDTVVPLLVYALDQPNLSQKDVAELHELKQLLPDSPIFFVMASQGLSNNAGQVKDSTQELTESKQHEVELGQQTGNGPLMEASSRGDGRPFWKDSKMNALAQQLESLGLLKPDEVLGANPTKGLRGERYIRRSCLVNGMDQFELLNQFVRGVLRSHLVTVAMHLNQVHCAILRRFILCAFDKAREIQITPRRMRYALEKETELYHALVAMASEKQAEVTILIEDTLANMRLELIEEAAHYQYRGASLSAAGENGPEGTPRAVRLAAAEIQQLVLSRLSHAVAERLVCSMDCLQDSVVGTLLRTLCSLERTDRAEVGDVADVAEPEHFESQDSKNSTESWDLPSCSESQGLVVSSSQSTQLASDALKQILSAAYSVQLSPSTSSSFLHGLFEGLKQLMLSVQLRWSAPPRLDAEWRKEVAYEMLVSLSPQRLAKSITSQFRERVRVSHEAFLAALRSLANHYTGHLEKTEEQRIAIRGHHAPRLARLALETTSLADMVQYGMPQLGKEIGRGQYGVVYSCESWGGTGPCAVKSVVPPDDKHWNDLAMEFYYTRTVPEHPRIVKLRGSVVDHSYDGGCSPAALLVMDRLTRDLHSGLRSGLQWKTRLQIAIDVVEGIRYLHSQGLVHRDVKLKNVLLDCDNRAKLTDLGFCIPEAMMSGSIVGTPVHMAPEMHSGHYDSSVDVYAFGILFWYLCAGNVTLPAAFELFHNKEQLWTSVRKGIRPERLAHFDSDCWQLMQECWSGDPSARPLLGFVQPQLEKILDTYSNGSSHLTAVEASSSGLNQTNGVDGFPAPVPNSFHVPVPAAPLTLPVPVTSEFWRHVREG